MTSEELREFQQNKSLEPQYVETILSTYKAEFEELVQEHQRGNVSDVKGSLAVLGLPLLTYLTLRLLFKVESENELQALIHNPTNLYRSLIDETCEGSGNPLLRQDLQQQNLYRLSGEKLRRLLWQTAQAITATGKESISRNELKYRCGVEELESIVREVTAENLLSRIIIGFFFKENTGEGCEFVHKSFREYLFAEAIVEELKNYGGKAKTYPEREVLWKDFDESDARYELTHNLSEQLAPCWLSAEVKTHILNILTWEIERSSQQLNSQTANSQPSMTKPISFGQWGYVRDGLADVWDWWAKGVLMRPQPTVERKRNQAPKYGFQAAYVSELIELCCPLDKSVWEPNLPLPASLNLVDARLGDGFFHLTAIVHGRLYEYARGKLSKI